MGVDIGTTGTKAVVFSETGKILALAYRTYSEIFPRPGWVEMDPQQIWTAVTDVIREVAAQVSLDPVRAIGVAVLGEAVTPIDSQFRPLCNTLPSVDARATAQVEWWDKKVGAEEIYRITGQPLNTSFSVNKMMWVREEMPEVFSRTWKFLLWEDLFCCWLGLNPVIEHSLASRTMAFDIHSRTWSQKLLALAKIPQEMLAEVAPAGTPVGTIPDAKAADLGLKPGVVVTVAGHDAFNGAFGAGVIDEGTAALTVGTAESIVIALEKPMTAESLLADKIACYCHTYDGRYAILAYSTCSGNLLRWYRDNFGCQEVEEARVSGKDAYDILVAKANLGKSKLLLQPHFVGSGTPRFDPHSRGAILGLNLSTKPADIIAAILEGTTFELKLNIMCAEKAGLKVKGMRAVGGGAKSDRWLQLKADITGVPITRLDLTECGALGSAIQAGVACGTFRSQGEALEQLVKPNRTFEPNVARGKQYDELFGLYCKLYDSTKPFSDALSKY